MQWWDGNRWTDVYENTAPTAVSAGAVEHDSRPNAAKDDSVSSSSRRLLWAFAFTPLVAVAAQAVLFQVDVEPGSIWWLVAVPVGAVVLLVAIAITDLVRLPPLKSDKSWGAIWTFLFPGYPAWRARATSTSYAPFAAWVIVLALSVTASGFLVTAAEVRSEERTTTEPTPPPTRFEEAQRGSGGGFIDPDAVRCAEKMTRLRIDFANRAQSFEVRTGRTWTIKEARARKSSGDADPKDPSLIKSYYKVWQFIADNPKCYDSEEVDEARRALKDR